MMNRPFAPGTSLVAAGFAAGVVVAIILAFNLVVGPHEWLEPAAAEATTHPVSVVIACLTILVVFVLMYKLAAHFYGVRDEPPSLPDAAQCENFVALFADIRRQLRERVRRLDAEAHDLLWKGISTAVAGFMAYACTIFIWQAIAGQLDSFKSRHLVGIGSCTILFGIAEFFAAWFLRQYRYFIDTSSSTIKIISLLDRYMLAYLALKEASADEHKDLVDMLSANIVWPDAPQRDDTFMREAADAFTGITQAVLKQLAVRRSPEVR